MNRLITIGIVFFAIGCTDQPEENNMQTHTRQQHHHGAPAQGRPHAHHANAHRHGRGTGAELIVRTEPAAPTAGGPVTLRLMIHAADGTMVKNFQAVHEEKVHLVIVRDGLDHFAHVHPAIDANGHLTVAHTFPAGGAYRLFADYAPAGGGHATATGTLTVGGQSPPAPALTPNAPGEVRGDGLRATVAAAPLKAGAPARVTFALRDDRDRPAELEPYMGELGHLMFVGVAAGQYVHVHPAGGDAARGKVQFGAHFPHPDLYKGWGQFKHRGRVRVVPIVLEVE